MRKFLIILATFFGLGYLLWRYWQEINAENARAWAAGTDPVE